MRKKAYDLRAGEDDRAGPATATADVMMTHEELLETGASAGEERMDEGTDEGVQQEGDWQNLQEGRESEAKESLEKQVDEAAMMAGEDPQDRKREEEAAEAEGGMLPMGITSVVADVYHGVDDDGGVAVATLSTALQTEESTEEKQQQKQQLRNTAAEEMTDDEVEADVEVDADTVPETVPTAIETTAAMVIECAERGVLPTGKQGEQAVRESEGAPAAAGGDAEAEANEAKVAVRTLVVDAVRTAVTDGDVTAAATAADAAAPAPAVVASAATTANPVVPPLQQQQRPPMPLPPPQTDFQVGARIMALATFEGGNREYHTAEIVDRQLTGARKFYVHYVGFNKRWVPPRIHQP